MSTLIKVLVTVARSGLVKVEIDPTQAKDLSNYQRLNIVRAAYREFYSTIHDTEEKIR